MKYETHSPVQTKKIAAAVARTIAETAPDGKAVVIAFDGDLGAGKTTFIQGFLRALGAKGPIASPTFTLLRMHKIRAGRFMKAYHFDCYRIHDPEEIGALGFGKMIEDPNGIILVEWPERIKALIPRKRVIVRLSHGNKLNERIIEIDSGSYK